MTIDLGWKSYGIGAEILAMIFSNGNINLKSNPLSD